MKPIGRFGMKLLNRLGRMLYRQWGDKPGIYDVSSMEPGQPFKARFNFRYCNVKLRPFRRQLWGPLYPQPANNKQTGQTINKGWPLEASKSRDEFDPGDWVEVTGQVLGQVLRDERGLYNGIWNVVLVPCDMLELEKRGIQRGHFYRKAHRDGHKHYVCYGADLWMGNTGWHCIPWNHQATNPIS